jgi:hypothetical protein
MDVPKTPQQELVEHAISAAGQMEQWAKTLSTEMGAGDDTVAIPQRLVSLLVSEMRTRAQAIRKAALPPPLRSKMPD